MDSKETIEMLQNAEEDKQLQAIILRIDSPGGAVALLRKFMKKFNVSIKTNQSMHRLDQLQRAVDITLVQRQEKSGQTQEH